LSGLLATNPNIIGHSQVRYLIQDRAFERQIFELIINLPNLQPIPEDRHEAENLSLSKTPAMAVALPLILFTPDFSYLPQVLIVGSGSPPCYWRGSISCPPCEAGS
jgi:hypothetical protein